MSLSPCASLSLLLNHVDSILLASSGTLTRRPGERCGGAHSADLLTSTPCAYLPMFASGAEIQPSAASPVIAHSLYSRHFVMAAILFWMGSEHLPYVFRCSRHYPQMCTKLQTSR